MNTLKLHTVADGDELAWPREDDQLSLATPAVAFFTDFEKIAPLVIQTTTTATEAKAMMLNMQLSLFTVVDEHQHFVGLISADDLLDHKMVQRISEGYKRTEILVSDLMHDKKNLQALAADEAMAATIDDVIEVLTGSGQHYCLVLEPTTHRVRGVFSTAEISRKLHMPIDVRAPDSFYRAFVSLGH